MMTSNTKATMTDFSVSPPSPIELTAQTFRNATRDLSRAVRAALKASMILRRGAFTVTLPKGTTYVIRGREPGPVAEVRIHDEAVIRRVLKAGDLGFHEAYVDGLWSSPDVTAVLELFARNSDIIDQALTANPFVKAVLHIGHWLNRNTKKGSKKNISAHYDLGNAFYSEWLDETMTYSSALFEPGVNSLAAAQTAKYRALARDIGVTPHDHVLEIGCGWGGFAEYVAKDIGARVTCLTISREQFDFATQRIAKAGLSDKVEIRFQDYRDERGTYDKIASIEMFEAVGQQFWGTYFDTLRDRLKPGGRAGLQVICIQERFFDFYRLKPDFIQKHIFPGGMLPTPTHLRDHGAKVGLSLTAERVFGHDYAATLAMWRERFHEAWPRIVPLGFDDRFKRLWEYYFHYCEAGFRAGNIDVRQVVYAKAT